MSDPSPTPPAALAICSACREDLAVALSESGGGLCGDCAALDAFLEWRLRERMGRPGAVVAVMAAPPPLSGRGPGPVRCKALWALPPLLSRRGSWRAGLFAGMGRVPFFAWMAALLLAQAAFLFAIYQLLALLVRDFPASM